MTELRHKKTQWSMKPREVLLNSLSQSDCSHDECPRKGNWSIQMTKLTLKSLIFSLPFRIYMLQPPDRSIRSEQSLCRYVSRCKQLTSGWSALLSPEHRTHVQLFNNVIDALNWWDDCKHSFYVPILPLLWWVFPFFLPRKRWFT